MIHFFFDERKKQLQNQEKIDGILHKLKDECSPLVTEYLLFQREFTRNQQFKVMNSSLLLLKKEIDNQLESTNNIEKIFFDNMHFPSCENLKSLIFLSKHK